MKQQQRNSYISESLRNITASSTNLHQLLKWKWIAEETGNTENRNYAEVTRAGRNLTRRLSKTNNADKTTNKTYTKNYAR